MVGIGVVVGGIDRVGAILGAGLGAIVSVGCAVGVIPVGTVDGMSEG